MAKHSWISSAANGILAVCAVVVTALVVRKEFFAAEPGASIPYTRVAAWRAFGEGGHRLGPENAPVRIVVFSDFQCPACRVLATHLKTIRAEDPNLEVVHRHAPLDRHEAAIPAARASDCAGAQGRFEAYHDALFAAQDSIGTTSWETFARRAAVPDLAAFKQCISVANSDAPLARDTLVAKQLNVTGTPTYLLNDMRFVGAPPLDSLRAHVARVRRSAATTSR
jgi:protein-disulfide isomerase